MRFRYTRQTNLIGFFVLVDVQMLLVNNTNNGGLFCLHQGLNGWRDFAEFWVYPAAANVGVPLQL